MTVEEQQIEAQFRKGEANMLPLLHFLADTQKCWNACQKPTQDQMDELRAFAKKHGNNWKMALHHAWFWGTAPALLQQIKDELGVVWLARFREIEFQPIIRRAVW